MQKNSFGSFYREPGLFGVRCCSGFCATGINDDHPTSENGKLVVLPSGRPAFQKHTKRTEGSDTTPSFACAESPARRVKKQQHHQIANRAARPSGAATPSGQRHASCASLSRRLSALFESTSRPRSQSGKVRRSDTWPRRVSETCETLRG